MENPQALEDKLQMPVCESVKLPSIVKPWQKYYDEKVFSRSIPNETIYERLIRWNTGKEAAVALSYFDNSITYRQLIDEVELAAAAFSAIGVKKGDIVAYCALTCPEVIVSMYALNKLGAAIMLLDPRRGIDEIKQYTAKGNVRILMLMDIFYPNISKILPELGMEKVIVSKMGRSAGIAAKAVLAYKCRKLKIAYDEALITYDSFLALGKGKKAEKVGYDEFEAAAITFSGGTTGIPKGIIISNLMMSSITEDLRALNKEGAKFCSMGIVPIFASYGLICGTHGPLGLNAKVVLIAKPDPDEFGKLIKKHKPTNIVLVPGYYEKLIESKALRGVDMSYLISSASGGDSMSTALEERVNAFLKEHNAIYHHVAQGYGMSEMGSVETVCYGRAYKPGSVGIPMPHVNLCIVESGTTRELGFNESGEICATGTSMMLGYLNDQEETDNILITHPDGNKWIHSGDTGYIDEDGFLFFTGRIKLAIPRPDGHKVFPIQLKNVVSKVENVEDCACVGVKDGINTEGQWPVVAVVLSDKSKKEETMEAIWAALKRGIEELSQPIDVYEVDAMPLIGMGKIDYKKLSEDYMIAHGIKF